MKIQQKLEALGLTLDSAPAPLANYVRMQRDGQTLWLSGASAIRDGRPMVQGKLGAEVSVQQGYQVARVAALTLLSVLRQELGDLERIEQIVKLTGFVACTPSFYEQPAVIDGASDLLVELLGDCGRHARSAVGVCALPLNLPVEIELVVRIRD